MAMAYLVSFHIMFATHFRWLILLKTKLWQHEKQIDSRHQPQTEVNARARGRKGPPCREHSDLSRNLEKQGG